MLAFDSFREILSTIGKNKLRTVLTGFAVAWGIFMLIILLASGNGFKNGVMSNFASRAQNSVSMWLGSTSVPYEGLPTNREIKFDDRDFDLIRNKMPRIEYVSVCLTQNVKLSYEKEYGSYTLNGVSQDAGIINGIEILSGQGRFLNKIDIDNKRKVIVIEADTKKVLFKDEDPLGKYVVADNNTAYQVVGVYINKSKFGNSSPAYIPFTTAQMLYNKGNGFDRIDFTVVGLTTIPENEAYVEQLRKKMGALHRFDPTDHSALYIRNTAEGAVQAEKIFSAINLFIWVIGCASLMAGIVGVGNIMLITVKERTREIGIRKAIGASPASVIQLVIYESVFITTIAGYLGMIVGIALTELISKAMEASANPNVPTIFKDPTVDLKTVALATLFLVVTGTVAGLIPAVKAARISPIEAMRSE